MIARPPDVPEELWPTAPYDALIFDCDGTLAENTSALRLAVAEALQPHGIEVAADWFDARRGQTTRDLIVEAAAENGVALDVDAVLAARRSAYEMRMHEVREIATVAAVVRAHAGRTPIAVASSGPRDVVGATLAAIGLLPLFDAVVTIEDVSRPKPAPDVFLLAAKRLGAVPEACLVYEDTEIGAAAARAAGMRTIVVEPDV
ncbi:MAG TPA: HAD family phosphatase [Solirubrobacterales bacterium]